MDSSRAELATIQSFIPGKDGNVVMTKLYDGSYNVQTVGDAADTAAITMWCRGYGAFNAINNAHAFGAVLIARWRGIEYSGYLKAAPNWKAEVAGEVWSAKVTMLVLPG